MHFPVPNFKIVALPALVALCVGSSPAFAEVKLTTERKVDVHVTDVRAAGTDVQGEIVNQTGATVVGAELLVRNHWMWADETNPGTDDPSWVETHPLNVQIPPGGKAPFSLQLSRTAPQRNDGEFRTLVSIRSFETIPSQ
jgi:hypothetical protein